MLQQEIKVKKIKATLKDFTYKILVTYLFFPRIHLRQQDK